MTCFVWGLLLLNMGAACTFGWQRNWPWALIYGGAATIQIGCLWATWR